MYHSIHQYIPSMMHSFDWRVRQAGLLAIAAMGEGTGKVMQKELKTIVECVFVFLRSLDSEH